MIIEDIKKLKQKINNKLGSYNIRDKQKKLLFPLENEGLSTIKLNDAINIVKNLDNNLCCGCGCEMLFYNYMPFCVYQFSFDRIDNKKIHSINNLRVICWNCNSMHLGAIKYGCTNKCHIYNNIL